MHPVLLCLEFFRYLLLLNILLEQLVLRLFISYSADIANHKFHSADFAVIVCGLLKHLRVNLLNHIINVVGLVLIELMLHLESSQFILELLPLSFKLLGLLTRGFKFESLPVDINLHVLLRLVQLSNVFHVLLHYLADGAHDIVLFIVRNRSSSVLLLFLHV